MYPRSGESALAYLAGYTDRPDDHSAAARGHPPGPVLLLWALHRLGLTDRLTLGLLDHRPRRAGHAAGAGRGARASAARSAARRYVPVLVLAPYAVWVAVSVDVVVAVLGAAMVAMGVRASAGARTGLAGRRLWALASGVTLGVAALFSYAAPWLGLSVVCLYFARRRAFLNVATGLGRATARVRRAQLAGFGWIEGMLVARADYAARIEPNRSALAWGGDQPGRAAARRRAAAGAQPGPDPQHARLAVPGRCRRRGGLLASRDGLARGGAEAAWLPFFRG